MWGGELLRGDLTSFERIGHLWPVRMPGGEAAIREPWRMACAWLLESGETVPSGWEQVAQLARSGLASPMTTSMGRLFDAVAALCGVRQEVTYEGQAAVELEALADRNETAAYPLDVLPSVEFHNLRLCNSTLARGEARSCSTPAPPSRRSCATSPAASTRARISARFHNAVAAATAEALRDEPVVVLSGGVFQNELLLARTLELLPRALVPQRLPVNDGGIAYGQAAIAARRAQIRTR